jgi:hypothetical protein
VPVAMVDSLEVLRLEVLDDCVMVTDMAGELTQKYYWTDEKKAENKARYDDNGDGRFFEKPPSETEKQEAEAQSAWQWYRVTTGPNAELHEPITAEEAAKECGGRLTCVQG